MLATQDLPASSTGAELGQELKRVVHQRDLLDLQAAALAAQFAGTNEYDVQGYATAIDWMRFNCHLTSTAAADLIAAGKNLHRLPESVQAVCKGEIGYAHVKAMARTANAVGPKFDESSLLEKARDNSAGKFYFICQHYRHSADRGGYEAEQRELVENRKLWISTCDDGSVLLNGIFDREGGATLRTALEPLARRSGAHDDRSRERRVADAAVELAMHGLDSGLVPQQGSQRTHLQVTTTLETLLGLPGAPAADLELSSLPISSKTVERLACDCSVTRILLGSDSVVIESAGPGGRSQDRRARRSTCATGAAPGRAASGRRAGPRDTTSSTGFMAARTRRPTSPCSATGITGWCTRATGRSFVTTTGACSPSRRR